MTIQPGYVKNTPFDSLTNQYNNMSEPSRRPEKIVFTNNISIKLNNTILYTNLNCNLKIFACKHKFLEVLATSEYKMKNCVTSGNFVLRRFLSSSKVHSVHE